MAHNLHLGVADVPTWPSSLLFGFQQAMLCISGLLVYPHIVSTSICAGDETVNIRVQLISATFVACGIATIVQTTFGLRLSVLHGPAIAFLPPLLAYKSTLQCSESETEYWEHLQVISGSLVLACTSFIIIGGTGLAGTLSRLVGPVTITPLMLLLSSSIVPSIEEKMSTHWVSIVMFIVVCLMAVYLENVFIPIPAISNGKLHFSKARIFGQFPYLISLSLVWFFCYILTVSGLEPENGAARTDIETNMDALAKAPWINLPYPGQFGWPKVSFGLTLGYVASCAASVIENLGSYDLLARVSHQKPPPQNAVNRAIMAEGIGSLLSASMGVCTGVTTYSENIALIHITRVASRVTMQVAGILLILIGLFGKGAALLASVPEPVIGGMLAMGVSMIAGVSLSNLQRIDLHITRNLSIIGAAFIIGQTVPHYIKEHGSDWGQSEYAQTLKMLLEIKMLVGGIVAVVLDNTVSGATAEQRGLHVPPKIDDFGDLEDDAYSFPQRVTRFINAVPGLNRLPFLPSDKEKSKRYPQHSPSTSSCDS